MATQNTAAELGKSGERAYVVGPVPDGETNVAQSLLDKQRKLASKPAEAAAGRGPEHDADRAEAIHNRIHGTGALTPASLARDIDAGLKKRAADAEQAAGKGA